MVILQLSGGLGNQMFQYALCLELMHRGRGVKIDDVTGYGPQEKLRSPLLADVFGIDYPRASAEEITAITDSYMDLFSRIRRKLTGRRTKLYHEGEPYRFDPKVMELTETYLVGCWQSEAYFSSVREEVRAAFRFPLQRLSERSREAAAQILGTAGNADLSGADGLENGNGSTAPVSVHVRRGDYLNAVNVYGGICTEAYYRGAVRHMLEKFGRCRFFVFSNDPAWVNENIETLFGADENLSVTVMDANDEQGGWQDMYLISLCRHHIIANSSFSWWGAWFSAAEDGEIVAPSRFINGYECPDIFTERMTLLDSEGRAVR